LLQPHCHERNQKATATNAIKKLGSATRKWEEVKCAHPGCQPNVRRGVKMEALAADGHVAVSAQCTGESQHHQPNTHLSTKRHTIFGRENEMMMRERRKGCKSVPIAGCNPVLSSGGWTSFTFFAGVEDIPSLRNLCSLGDSSWPPGFGRWSVAVRTRVRRETI
jgi:hypothetical protein